MSEHDQTARIDTGRQVLVMSTNDASLRSDAWGWSCDDAALFKPGEPIGMTPGPRFPYAYATPLEAMWDGWRLLAPPERCKDGKQIYAEWWFVR